MSTTFDDMTIEEATKHYIDEGEAIYSDDASMVSMIQSTGCEGALKNSNYVHALRLTGLMYDATNTSIRIVTGAGCDGFIKTLRDKFIAMLTRLKENRGMARVIIVDTKEEEVDLLKQFEQQFQGTIEVKHGKSAPDAKVEHRIVCDGRMLRKEEYHAPVNKKTKASDIKAKVYFHNKSKAASAEDNFDIIWKKLP